MQFLRLVNGTLLLRPYVFAFLAAYLVIAVPMWGWRRTALYTACGYGLAWLAEYGSTHIGIPFGPYSYISAPTMEREFWVAGVPFMDSLSFVFLSFAGMQTARLILEKLRAGPGGTWDLRFAEPSQTAGWRVWLLGGLLTMGLDLIIDPVALQGDRWFLGQIYSYPPGGAYFGVTLENFVGWAALAWTIIGTFLLLERLALRRVLGEWRGRYADALLGAGLFTGVLAFNLGVTFAIGEIGMGLAGLFWTALMLAPVAVKLTRWRATVAQGASPSV